MMSKPHARFTWELDRFIQSSLQRTFLGPALIPSSIASIDTVEAAKNVKTSETAHDFAPNEIVMTLASVENRVRVSTNG